MKKGKNKSGETAELPDPRWDSDAENLQFRIDRAITLAKEHLEGYSNDGIQFIWEVIRPGLFYESERTYRLIGVKHPPIDRLFDMAFDINGYTNSIIEGDIEASAICAVYALKTAEHAADLLADNENVVSACLVCTDAWRALTFMPRADYLKKKFKRGYDYNKKGKGGKEEIIQKIEEKHEDYNYYVELVTDVYEKNIVFFKDQEKTGILKPKSKENKDLIEGGKLKKWSEYLALEIHYILVSNGKILKDTGDGNPELSTDQIIRMIQTYERKKTENKLREQIKEKGIVLTDAPLTWPARSRAPKPSTKMENFFGEIPGYRKGNATKFRNLIRQRVREREIWDLTDFPKPL